MPVQVGRVVQKGQMRFRIDPRCYEAAVQSTGVVVERTEANLEMAWEQLHLANAQSGLDQTRARLLKANRSAACLEPLAARRAVRQTSVDDVAGARLASLLRRNPGSLVLGFSNRELVLQSLGAQLRPAQIRRPELTNTFTPDRSLAGGWR